MRENRNKRVAVSVKLPLIKYKPPPMFTSLAMKSLKLYRINRQKNMALIDISKINKIEKEYAMMTHRKDKYGKETELKDYEKNKDEMRESKLLLLRNLAPQPTKKLNANLLSSLVAYNNRPNRLMKSINIPPGNISLSPEKKRKYDRKLTSERNVATRYQQAYQLQQVDFVRMFIVYELLYYISKTGERLREEMAGFCKFYNENTDYYSYTIISQVLLRSQDYLTSVFYEKLGFYVFLILGTDADIQQYAHYLLNSLGGYMHTNNLIVLDLLMEIIDMEKFPISSQFHIYNTSRFNEDRRKIKHCEDRLDLVAKNNATIAELIRGVVTNCGFYSLKTFVFEILVNSDAYIVDKIREVSLMLVSLDNILTSTVQQMPVKPKPPFLPPREKNVNYTLVLDMDETLIHTREMQAGKSSFLVRPHCQQFLDEMDKYYEIVVFTAAVKEYADSILDSIDQAKRISHRLYREHTRIEEFVSIKDLLSINRDLTQTIIIDNIASNFKLQPRNGIEIATWTGEAYDNSLLNLIPVLKKLAIEGVKDVRDGLEVLSEYMEKKMSKGQYIVFDEISLKGA